MDAGRIVLMSGPQWGWAVRTAPDSSVPALEPLGSSGLSHYVDLSALHDSQLESGNYRKPAAPHLAQQQEAGEQGR